jgi:DeoR/GlpR family transcriptional regulator of sugar metabolism
MKKTGSARHADNDGPGSRADFPKDRQEKILKLLRATQRVWGVDELIEFFKVSPMTIRRALTQLEQDGVILRTHGGCIATMYSQFLGSYQDKIASNFELKSSIGKLAAKSIGNARTVMLFDGSTTFHVLSHLSGFENLSIYTNSIAMISELSRFPKIDVFVLGGKYNRSMSFLEGGFTEAAIQQMHFDVVFFGVDAISPGGECFVANHETAGMIQHALERSKRKVLLADHTKTRMTGRVRCVELGALDMWITTGGLSAAERKRFERMVRLLVADNRES